jgi:hypothetical protein
MTGRTSQPSRPKRPKHWGLRTLAFLGLAAASIFASNLLDAKENNDYALLTVGGLLVGLVGATICSYHGLRSSDWLSGKS